MIGTVATILLPGVYLMVGALLQVGRSGTSSLGRAVADSLGVLAMVGSIAMTAMYALGVPIALQAERRLAARGAVRWLTYGVVGAVGSAAIGAFFAGATAGVLIFVPFGLIAALGGAAGVAWSRRRSARVVRRVGPGATSGLVVVALLAWLVGGAVLVPLVVASVAGAVVLTLCLLTERDGPTGAGS